MLLLCLAAAAMALVDAGGYRNGYKPPTRTATELYMNYEEAVPQLKHHKARRRTALHPFLAPFCRSSLHLLPDYTALHPFLAAPCCH